MPPPEADSPALSAQHSPRQGPDRRARPRRDGFALARDGGRNLAGSSIEGKGIATVASGTNAQLGDVVRDQAIEQVNRARQVADRDFGGAIATRGQDIGAANDRVGHLQSLMSAPPARAVAGRFTESAGAATEDAVRPGVSGVVPRPFRWRQRLEGPKRDAAVAGSRRQCAAVRAAPAPAADATGGTAATAATGDSAPPTATAAPGRAPAAAGRSAARVCSPAGSAYADGVPAGRRGSRCRVGARSRRREPSTHRRATARATDAAAFRPRLLRLPSMNEQTHPWRRPGFTIPGYAAAAASKNHRLGTAHQFDRRTASDAGKRSVERRREIRRAEDRDANRAALG